jgi:hypothetical protein
MPGEKDATACQEATEVKAKTVAGCEEMKACLEEANVYLVSKQPTSVEIESVAGMRRSLKKGLQWKLRITEGAVWGLI